MKKTLHTVVFLFFLFSLAGCGGGSSSGGSTTSYTNVNTLDGATGVDVYLPFRYTFSGSVTGSSVTTATYFIVPTPTSGSSSISATAAKATLNSTICDASNAVGASVSASGSSATITPSPALSGNTGYTVCLTTGIQVDGSPFAGFMASFDSQGGGGGGGTTQTDRLRITNSCSYD